MQTSFLSAVIDFEPTHDLHVQYGLVSFWAAFLHSAAHIARYLEQGEGHYIVSNIITRSGVFAWVCMFPIVLMMQVKWLRDHTTYEARKAVHYLFLPMMAALCYHTPCLAIYCAIILIWYVADSLFFYTSQTYLVERPVFTPVGRGTSVSFELPRNYHFTAGQYIYVNCPWISRSQWHTFSIIPAKGSAAMHAASFYAEAVGDWTTELFARSLQTVRRPVWISRALPSVMDHSIGFDRVLLVGTGVGITPAVSVIERYAGTKHISLLWMSRDAHMIALYKQQLRRVHTTVHYTGGSDKEFERLRRLLCANGAGVESDIGGRPRSPTRDSWGDDEISVILGDSDSEDEQQNREVSMQEYNLQMKIMGLDPERGMSTPNRQVKGSNPMFQNTNAKHNPAMSTGRISRRSFRRGGAATTVSGSPRGSGVKGEYDPVPVIVKKGRPDIRRAIQTTLFCTAGGPLAQQKLDPQNVFERWHVTSLMRDDAMLRSQVAGIMVGNRLDWWTVIYCGASTKVADAISEQCKELGVSFRHEWFGEW
ncbi:unnamed protein product [Phaeothamnion confervicola]